MVEGFSYRTLFGFRRARFGSSNTPYLLATAILPASFQGSALGVPVGAGQAVVLAKGKQDIVSMLLQLRSARFHSQIANLPPGYTAGKVRDSLALGYLDTSPVIGSYIDLSQFRNMLSANDNLELRKMAYPTGALLALKGEAPFLKSIRGMMLQK